MLFPATSIYRGFSWIFHYSVWLPEGEAHWQVDFFNHSWLDSSFCDLVATFHPISTHIPDLLWLVVYLPLWKIWESVGMMTFPLESQKKTWFQTTNQIIIIFPLLLVYTLLATINITMFQSPPTSVCWFINHYNPHIPTSSLERTSKQHHLKRGSQPAGAFVDEFQARIVCRV
jgi:hypothetical protein